MQWVAADWKETPTCAHVSWMRTRIGKHLPVVTLVVQGDPGMLDGVLAAARGRTPIILVVGSGGCADAIHRALFGEVQNDGTAEDEGNWV